MSRLCDRCGGRGRIPVPRQSGTGVCPSCRGRGLVPSPDLVCPLCKGAGKVPDRGGRVIGPKAWDVRRAGRDRVWDTVFYDADCTADHVRRGLIEHDGYPDDIVVECEATGERSPSLDADSEARR